MNTKKNITKILSCIFIVLAFTCSCRSSTPSSNTIAPFSDLNWNSTVDDILDSENVKHSTYDSVYGGLCYTYPKEYNGYKGTVKYMLNEEEELMAIAWTYSSENTQLLNALYDNIHDSISQKYGKSGQEAEGVNNYGDVWYLDEGNILLSLMLTSDVKALQYSYLNPKVSTEK